MEGFIQHGLYWNKMLLIVCSFKCGRLVIVGGYIGLANVRSGYVELFMQGGMVVTT